MFEKWAVTAADYIKKANPEETEPHDVLVFGFTILFNVLFTLFLLFCIGWLLEVPFLVLQVALSFMIVRILTGGAHLDHSLACSLASILYILVSLLLPINDLLMNSYFAATILLLLRYAPYYEPHQLKHSQQWERKKKLLAIIWVIISIVLYHFFLQPGLLFGALLQALSLTPAGINLTHMLNTMLAKGGENHEKNS
ncbi:accessory gene regulator B [Caldalkalibacillus uzonensis]|uniref:Accessory gene regulator B n=1 Tax=Caldalkalibacillus uzonensis TaxID=353224 RepID=A0ABU0CUK3_9BACI|nr:accessory gene regulator B family protein [Caldalkalibacillus uzonensis]MDQ0340091.1 accessory gene regulator B [Caldalkalibacillus uzonensis]